MDSDELALLKKIRAEVCLLDSSMSLFQSPDEFRKHCDTFLTMRPFLRPAPGEDRTFNKCCEAEYARVNFIIGKCYYKAGEKQKGGQFLDLAISLRPGLFKRDLQEVDTDRANKAYEASLTELQNHYKRPHFDLAQQHKEYAKFLQKLPHPDISKIRDHLEWSICYPEPSRYKLGTASYQFSQLQAERYKREYDSFMGRNFRTHKSITILRDIPLAFTIDGHVFETWHSLSHPLQVYVSMKNPEILKNLKQMAEMWLYVMLAADNKFSKATVRIIRDFVWCVSPKVGV